MVETPLPPGPVQVMTVTPAEARRAEEIKSLFRAPITAAAVDPSAIGISAVPAEVEPVLESMAAAAAKDPAVRAAMPVGKTRAALTAASIATFISSVWVFVKFIPTQIPFNLQTFDMGTLLALIIVMGGAAVPIVRRYWPNWADAYERFFKKDEEATE